MIELLIAGLLSVMVLLAVYFVFIGNTTQYYRQEQIVQMQESMRFALEYLKNDLRNAGRLGLIRGDGLNRDPRLCTDRANLAALALCEGEQPVDVLRANGNELAPDRIRMVGDSGGGVMLKTSRVRPGVVVLAPAGEQATAEARSIVSSRRRSERMFEPGMLLAVRAPGGPNSLDIVEIAAFDFNAGGSTIRLVGSLCDDPTGVVSPTLATCSGECLVNPVQIIEYAIDVDLDPEPPRRPGEVTRLVRRVLPSGTRVAECGEERALETLVLAEMAVDLQLWGVYADPLRAAPPANADPTDDVGSVGEEEMERLRAGLGQVRSLTVMLAVRTPREDPEYTVAIGRADAPNARVPADRSWFELDPAPGTGLARVTTLTATVDAMNFVPTF